MKIAHVHILEYKDIIQLFLAKKKSEQVDGATPPGKKSRSLTGGFQGMDQYEATNYHVKLSAEEKMMAENDLSNAKETPIDDRSLYLKTRALQRNCFESESVKDQMDKFPWLKNVRIQF